MNYQVLDVKVKDTEETAKLYTYFLDNSREIAPERVRPVIDIAKSGTRREDLLLTPDES